jgi:ureidoglycolate hydrolase
MEEYDSEVPEPVKASVRSLLGSELHNYSLVSKNYFKKINNGKTKEYYEVNIVNKNDKKDRKTLVLAPDGTVLKTRG